MILFIVVMIQVGLIAMLANFTSERFASRQPILANRIYLASIALVLALVPIHLTLQGPTIQLPTIGDWAANSTPTPVSMASESLATPSVAPLSPAYVPFSRYRESLKLRRLKLQMAMLVSVRVHAHMARFNR